MVIFGVMSFSSVVLRKKLTFGILVLCLLMIMCVLVCLLVVM